MVEIGGQALAPIFRRHLVDGVAVVSGRVVDEDRDGPDRVARAPDGRLKGGDVAHVAVLEMHTLAQFLRQSLAGLGVVVEDGDLAALGMKRTRDALADAAGAAGDENGLALQGAVDGLGHQFHLNSNEPAVIPGLHGRTQERLTRMSLYSALDPGSSLTLRPG